jgi:hypothetical protein
MRILDSRNQISRLDRETKRNQNELEKNRNHSSIIDFTKLEADSEIFEILQFLQKIYKKFRKDNEIIDKVNSKRRHFQLK